MLLSFLAQCSLFSQFSPENLEIMSCLTKQHFHKKDALILNYDQSKTTFLYLINDWIKLFGFFILGLCALQGKRLLASPLSMCPETFSRAFNKFTNAMLPGMVT